MKGGQILYLCARILYNGVSMKPTVAIVGRPNVGKSTLFNKLTGKRVSIVEDAPGVTRDRVYCDAEWCGRIFTLIDTGGLEIKSDDKMWRHIRLQAEVAVDIADVIVLLVDGKAGLTSGDRDVAQFLRKSKKPVIVAVNKLDNNEEERIYDFYELGMDEVVGMLDTRDYFRLQDRSRENVMKKAVHPVFFVHESMPANTLFYKMQNAREHVAIVLDEFGGTDGIITIRDLLELLVGEMTDKDEKDEFGVKQLEDGGWELTGLVPIEEAEEKTGITFPEENKEDCETVSGYVCNVLGYIPDDGATASARDGNIVIDVTKVEQHRITGVVLHLEEKKPIDEEEKKDYNESSRTEEKGADNKEDKQ